MREFYEENKSGIKIAVIMIVFAIVMVVVNNIINNSTTISKPEDILITLGADYYEKAIFPTIEEYDDEAKNALLTRYSSEGIKVTARQLVTAYQETVDSSVFYREGNYCNYLETYVMIYPVYPYAKTDYKLETTVSCSESLGSNEEDNYVGDEPDGGTPNKAE